MTDLKQAQVIRERTELEKRNYKRLEASRLDKRLYFLMFKNGFSRHRNMRGCCGPCEPDRNKPCLVEEALFLSAADAMLKEAESEGIELEYSTQILVGQAAMTLVRLLRAQLMEAADFAVEEDYMIQHDRVHPIYYGYIPKLQKALVFFMDQLGITPRKKAERKSVKIAKSLQLEIEAMQSRWTQNRKINLTEKASVDFPPEIFSLDVKQHETEK